MKKYFLYLITIFSICIVSCQQEYRNVEENSITIIVPFLKDSVAKGEKSLGLNLFYYINLNNDSVFLWSKSKSNHDKISQTKFGYANRLTNNDTLNNVIEVLNKLPKSVINSSEIKEIEMYCGLEYYMLFRYRGSIRTFLFRYNNGNTDINKFIHLLLKLQTASSQQKCSYNFGNFNQDSIVNIIYDTSLFKNTKHPNIIPQKVYFYP